MKVNGLNNRGFSLISVMAAAAIAGVVALVMTQIGNDGVRMQRLILSRQSALAVQMGIYGLLYDRATCTANFLGVDPTIANSTPLNNRLTGADGTQVFFQTGNTYDNNVVRLRGMTLGNVRRLAAAPSPDQFRIHFDLLLDLEATGQVLGPARVVRIVTLQANLRGFTGGNPPNQIQNCTTVGSGAVDVWRVSPANISDIFYLTRNVGIGLDTPTSPLHVEGLAQFAPRVVISDSGPDQATLEVAGTVFAEAFVHSSDRSLKTDIQTSSGLNTLAQLRGVHFRWRDSKEPAYGFVADEVAKVYPEMVQTMPNGKKAVAYGQLIAPLIEAVKELKAENEYLRDELRQIKEEIRNR